MIGRVAALGAVVVGAFLFLLAVTIGDCAAFGGTCPRDGLNDDVIGTAATAGALIGGGVVFARHPTLRRWTMALVAALLGAIVLAVIATGMTSS